ncbi:helix-turn-helix domain-containing protein [Calycomorphotria hydatis]|uniref:Helix-turn-helix domain protein n=1 Tax=Calycomorphotria hydatis TaxID=2528027 RepID=A0A517TA79_9PLAN|nr:helix-turn-helix domain-containing protein [Calycomorphotria hydatis]QDT65277.1 Helix-turn-helix domain protein [Calycomorphotria hydatis]
MSTQQQKLSKSEISRAFQEGTGAHYPVILSPAQLGKLIGVSPKTIYDWIAKGRLDGAFRKRGKHNLIWRDRALDILFNGKEWN